MSDFTQTPEQIANCRKLIAYLRTLPAEYPDFEMSDFTTAGGDEAHLPACGTAACAVGHGPAAGVAPEDGESWFGYSTRCFMNEESDEWHWCFSGGWARTDNTAHGAADRIEWLIDRGLPKNADYQRLGYDGLCYRTEAEQSA